MDLMVGLSQQVGNRVGKYSFRKKMAFRNLSYPFILLERETGFEPATLSLEG
jgi:hypothetical protein